MNRSVTAGPSPTRAMTAPAAATAAPAASTRSPGPAPAAAAAASLPRRSPPRLPAHLLLDQPPDRVAEVAEGATVVANPLPHLPEGGDQRVEGVDIDGQPIGGGGVIELGPGTGSGGARRFRGSAVAVVALP